MRTLVYRKTDAFTAGASLGNPAASIYLAEGEELTDQEMQDIARRHKGFVSEVVYCRAESPCRTENPAVYHLTYYSSECEVDFCGHATIACLYSLIRSDPGLLSIPEIPIRTRRKGDLTVYNRIPGQDAVYISAPTSRHIGTVVDPDRIAAALGITPDKQSDDMPADCIDAGLVTLIVPLAELPDVIGMHPDEQRLKVFCLENGFDIVLVFSLETANPCHHAHTRVFAPKFGYLEDPATGSGNSALGAYLLKNGLWDGGDISIEQGGEDVVYNIVRLTALGDGILFGGSATDRIAGEYFL